MEYQKIVCYIQKIFMPVEKEYGFTSETTNHLSCITYTNQCYKVIIYVGREIEFQIEWISNRPHVTLDDYQVAKSVKKEYRSIISDDDSIHYVVTKMVEIIALFLISYYGDEGIMRALKHLCDEEESMSEKEEFDNDLNEKMNLFWKEGKYTDFIEAYKELKQTPTKLLQKKYEYAKKHFKNS